MKLTVEFLSLPNIVKLIGSKAIAVDFSGLTVRELIQELCSKYGKGVQQFLLDENGELDIHLTVVINKQERIHHDQLDRPLRDGDRVTIMMLAAGG